MKGRNVREGTVEKEGLLWNERKDCTRMKWSNEWKWKDKLKRIKKLKNYTKKYMLEYKEIKKQKDDLEKLRNNILKGNIKL